MIEEDNEEHKKQKLLDEIYIPSMRLRSLLHILQEYTEQKQENSAEIFNINEVLTLCVQESNKIFDLYHKSI